MALSTSNNDTIERRREIVSQLRLRQLSVREIAIQLATMGMVNPKTGEPYTHMTIVNDLEALKIAWRESANAATSEHQARQVAEIAEIKRSAWGTKDPELVLKALGQETKLLGTLRQPDGVTININIEVMQRFEATANELGIDASQAIEEFRMMLIAQHSANTGSGAGGGE